jgi:predicted O-linked N-acetylglucosamine transferase (SPINDLY family)
MPVYTGAMKSSVDQVMRKAAVLARQGQTAEAKQLYLDVLHRFPANRRAADGLRALPGPSPDDLPPGAAERLVTLSREGKFQEALDEASALLPRYPDAPLLHSVVGVAEARFGRFEQALAGFDAVLRLMPSDAAAHGNRGNALRSLQRLEEAVDSFDQALRHDPATIEVWINRGNCLMDLGRFSEALAAFDAALELDPGREGVWYNRGNVLLELARLDEALASYDRAIALKPAWAEAHNNRGNLLRECGRLDEALSAYDAAVRLKSDLGSAHNNRAVLLKDLKRLDEALAASDLAVRWSPDFNAHNNRGVILTELKRLEEALVSFDSALRLKPDSAAAYNNAGNVLQDLGRFDDAVKCYDAAIAVSPELLDAYGNRGNAFDKLGRPVEAIASYAEMLRRKPDLAPVKALLLYQKAQICDWSAPPQKVDFDTLGVEGEAVAPFTVLAADGDPARQLARARRWCAKLPAASPPLPKPAARPDRLRIGYFSADYHGHAVMFLAARLFEVHDRNRFEVHAFSYGPDTQDAMRARAVAAFDRFHHVGEMTDAGAAGLARDRGIDIAIDLSGYTRGARTGIFAHRAAPVQMNYLGYPGSMGADFIDYIVADRIVLPPPAYRFYDEKVITLPHSYQANDNRRGIAAKDFTRAELGLPEQAFVFCCFNANYKISPAEFDVWMRLLGKVENGVIWLLEGSRWARANLCREAEARGIDPGRLVFAPRMHAGDHLARHRAADLFLDTFNYNAHTTGSDALWAGLPIVTRLGASFAARVGGSLLEATGMGELATHSTAEYEELALALATDPARLAAVRAKLAAQLPTAPLFDSDAFARHIERAYDLAHARRVAGLPPDHIVVDGAARA